MATRFEYMYRDASNYKAWEVVFLEGDITDEEIAQVLEARHDGEWFIPEQVGLQPARGEGWEVDYDDDHCWHELDETSFDVVDDGPPTVMTVKDFLSRVLGAAREGWNAVRYAPN